MMRPSEWLPSGPTEQKSCDTDITPPVATMVATAAVVGHEFNVANTGLTYINQVAQGPGRSERIGTKIIIKNINVKVCFRTTAATQATIRYAIVYDKQSTGAFPNLADIFQNDNGGVTFAAPVNPANRARFIVLRDKYVDIDSSACQIKWVNEYVKGSWEVDYTDANGVTIANIVTGAIYFICYTNLPIANAITFSDAQARIRYSD